MILVTGHRRENFGEKFVSFCRALRRIATERSDIRIVYAVHFNPNVQQPVRSILDNLAKRQSDRAAGVPGRSSI